MTTAPELLPCPFCGCEVELVSSKNAPDRLLVIACKSPSPCIGSGLGGFYILESQRDDGIAAWNRREAATALSEAKAENERLTRERDAFFDSLRQLICINSVLTALRSTAPLWLEHAERLIDERNALNPKGGDNEA